jgi:hypothetical protein
MQQAVVLSSAQGREPHVVLNEETDDDLSLSGHGPSAGRQAPRFVFLIFDVFLFFVFSMIVIGLPTTSPGEE